MDLSNYLTLDVIFSFVILIAVLIYIFSYSSKREKLDNTKNNNTKNNTNNNNNTNDTKSNTQQKVYNLDNAKKVLYYFGGHHCPHSNRNSRMFNFVINKFSIAHPDVAVMVFWGDNEQEQEEFRKHNVEYVPTIVNKTGQKIKVGLPDNFDTTGKSDDELENVVINNLYNQLN